MSDVKDALTDERLAELSAAADKCHQDCSDYSCVRMGSCTGFAGHAYSDAIRQRDQERKQAESDKALAEQINRLKRLGAI